MLNVKLPNGHKLTINTQHSTFNIQHSTFNITKDEFSSIYSKEII